MTPANPHRGEASFELEGKTYTLRFTWDALCRLETLTGKGIVAITAEFANPLTMRADTTRAALWIGLSEYHGEEVSLEQAGDLIPALGGIMAVADLLVAAFTLMQPEPKKEGEGAKGKRPQKAGGITPKS